ncbi:hypothetical protein MTL_21510 [Methylobacterium goesingense]|uniref:hypothetical protein n=1 Tax=Methylobacterium goesingense TaxID=243690 RepID=UPI001FAB6767|nr:hypothetical protein [Methylobacterium goesingense]MCI9882621.1 hypothetical protein [Methylobacterium goesingense]
MLTHHQIYHRRAVATFTTSRLIDTAPRHLARALQHPWLFRPPAAEPQRPPPIAIDLNPAPDRCGALTLHSQCGYISERRPLRTRHDASTRVTAAADDEAALPEGDETPVLALTIDLTPQIQPGPTISTRATLSVHFVREPWWPNDLTDALDALADLWLRRLAELPTA